jgi:hypothetical protein
MSTEAGPLIAPRVGTADVVGAPPTGVAVVVEAVDAVVVATASGAVASVAPPRMDAVVTAAGDEVVVAGTVATVAEGVVAGDCLGSELHPTIANAPPANNATITRMRTINRGYGAM